MLIYFLARDFTDFEGYGRYAQGMFSGLHRKGLNIYPMTTTQYSMPQWLHRLQRSPGPPDLVITCLPPFMLPRVNGRHWALTMTEGTEMPKDWPPYFKYANLERIIVPTQYSADVFSGWGVPVHIVPGGTEPSEFPVLVPPVRGQVRDREHFTFLTLADRGARKGWTEVWMAFFEAFGSPEDTPDVRLIIKCRPDGNEMVTKLASLPSVDPRIIWQAEDLPHPYDVYKQADCVVLPSRSEGWGMPHREAAMMGIPVITLKYSGLDDGTLDEWSIPIGTYTLENIPSTHIWVAGKWARADTTQLASAMRTVYDDPTTARQNALRGAQWLRDHQTWEHAASQLLELIEHVS